MTTTRRDVDDYTDEIQAAERQLDVVRRTNEIDVTEASYRAIAAQTLHVAKLYQQAARAARRDTFARHAGEWLWVRYLMDAAKWSRDADDIAAANAAAIGGAS